MHLLWHGVISGTLKYLYQYVPTMASDLHHLAVKLSESISLLRSNLDCPAIVQLAGVGYFQIASGMVGNGFL